MTKDKALDLALEALEFALHVGFDESSESQIKKGDKAWQQHQKAITAIKQALAAPVQEPVAGKGKELSEQLKLCARNVAFAASGWVDMSSAAMQEMFALIDHVCVGLDSPPAQPAPVQEPVAWMYPDDYERMTNSETFCTVYSVEVGSATRGESTVALYTTPPAAQRQWVGLTDEDIIKCTPTWGGTVEDVARAIEAKLKEKNT